MDPLAEDYLNWLASQISAGHEDQRRTYWDLLTLMFEKEFESLVPNDDNRMDDGKELRVEYYRYHNIRTDVLSDLGEANFLEVLIGLSRRLSFSAGGNPGDWAWRLITNLELHRMSDPIRQVGRVNRILDNCIKRNYAPNGFGGFFPLENPQEDQTRIELWYQMAAYVNELFARNR